ncbi:hypothetical protein CYY_000295 [Polysphondylium violaceum]|uniref:Pre-rRNA-processing protein RIX1 N-terminal domain-containing protein n=1 Tax=Polysphondylium violaceum TaxID=133409 RepID=A0A8J4Q1W2_9MYCE|nr:hypothetical protein CYY_000295 [Polysphondylium violaceum]
MSTKITQPKAGGNVGNLKSKSTPTSPTPASSSKKRNSEPDITQPNKSTNKQKQNTNKKMKKQTTTTTNNHQQHHSLSHDNILKCVIDTYIMPLVGDQDKIPHFLDIQSYLPNIIVLLHQNQCLKLTLNSTEPSSEKLKTKWVEILNFMLKSNNIDSVWMGVHLLCETIRVCDYDMMVQKSEQWITLLCNLAEQQKKQLNSQTKRDKNDVLISFKEYGSITLAVSLLVEKASHWADLKRSLTTNSAMSPIVSIILQSLESHLGYPTQSKIDSLVAISSLITSVGTAIKPYLNKIETQCYPLLFSLDKSIQEAASSVISNLPNCVGINSTDLYWDVTVQKILVELNRIIDQIYNGLEDHDDLDSDGKPVKLPTRSINLPNSNKLINLGDDQIVNMLKNLSNVKFPEPPKDTHQQSSFILRGFHGLCLCLMKILSSPTIAPSPVPLDEIIKLLCRILNGNINHLNFSHLLMSYSLSQVIYSLSQLHLQSFILLSQCLKVFKKSLLVHCKTISSLLLRPLRSLNYSLMSPIIHSQIYTTVTDAIEAFGPSCCESLVIPLIPILLRDIQPYIPEEISATTTTTTAAGSNTTANGTTAGSSLAKSKSQKDLIMVQDFTSITIKQNGLKTLSCILLYCGSYLLSSPNIGSGFEQQQQQQQQQQQSNLRLEIDQLIITLLLQCQSLSSNKKNSSTYLNSSFHCWRYRLRLYECLINSVLKPVPYVPPVLPYAIRILTVGMNTDYYPKVRNLCSKGVSLCESLIHPQSPSLVSNTNIYSRSFNFSSNNNNNNNNSNNNNTSLYQSNEYTNSHFESEDEHDDDEDVQDESESEEGQDEIDQETNFNQIKDSDQESDENGDDGDDDKLDISFNSIDNDEQEDDEKPTSTTKSKSMKSNLFDFGTISKTNQKNDQDEEEEDEELDEQEGKEEEVNDKSTKTNIATKNNQDGENDDDDDDDLPDIVDDPPSD